MTLSSASVLFVAYNPEDVKPGWIALVLVIALAVATYLLWRSMNKQLDKIDVPTQQELRDAEDGTPDDLADPARDEDRPPDS